MTTESITEGIAGTNSLKEMFFKILIWLLISLVILIMSSPWSVKIREDKHMMYKLYSIPVSGLLILGLNAVVYNFTINFLWSWLSKSIIANNKEALEYAVSIIITFTMFITNYIVLNLFFKIEEKFRKHISHIVMTIIAAIEFWMVSFAFVTSKWDLSLLYEGIGKILTQIVLITLAVLIPALIIVFEVTEYKALVYLESKKTPIRLKMGDNLIENDKDYTIICRRKRKGIKKYTIPKEQILRTEEFYK